MPIMGGGGGGAAFNGGTITNGLEIDNPSNSTNALTIKEQLGGTVDTIGPGGELHLAANYGQANDIWALRVDPGDNGSALGLSVRNRAGAAQVWYTDSAGAIQANAGSISIDFAAGAVSIAALANGQTPLTLRPHTAADAPLVIQDQNGVATASIASTGIVSQKGAVTAAITAGALPTTAFVSGTGKQILTTRNVFLVVPCTLNPTAGAAGTVKVELSPDN